MKTKIEHGRLKSRLYRALPVGLVMALSLSAQQAQAQAPASGQGVQIYGVVGLYVDRLERSNMADPLVQVGHGGLTTSFIGFRGQEDLGAGIKAIYSLESFFQSDTGALGRNASDPLFSRNAWVGVSSPYGNVTVGRQTNPTYIAMGMLSPFGGSTVFSPLVLQTFIASYGGAIVGDTVWSNAIQYVSPTVGGFTGAVMHGLGEVAGNSSVNNTGLHMRYRSGALTAAVSAQRNRTGVAAPSDGQDTFLAGAAYDFKVARISGAVVRAKTDGTDLKARTYDLGLSVPVSAVGAVWLEWARTKRELPGTADTKRDTASIAYNHVLSKRTNVYAVYSRDKLTGFSSGDTYGVGVRHSF